MKKIQVAIIERHELSLKKFILRGLSFGICRAVHCWPPLATFNGFLGCGYDDVDHEERVMEWKPFEITEKQYLRVVAKVDPEFTIDCLGTEDGDWEQWFLKAGQPEKNG